MSQQAVGVFDSGIGGLTVMKAIVSLLPNENIIYLGDTARAPYGSKLKSEVIQYTLECADFLTRRQAKALVVACNTMTALALPILTQEIDLPVVGMIEPATRQVARQAEKIGLIATKNTIESGAYQQAIGAGIYTKACPLLAPLVEGGVWDSDEANRIVNDYLAEFAQRPIDTLILGCTHYPLLAGVIANNLPPQIALFNPAEAVAKELQYTLQVNNLLNEGKGGHRKCFFTSSNHKAGQVLQRLGLKVNFISTTNL